MFVSDTFHWAFLNDLQMPYHDQRALDLWLKVMRWWKPDAIDILGDIDDQLQYSSFSDGTTDEFFSKIKKSVDESPLAYIANYSKDTRDLLNDLRKRHPNADIHFSLGNHEERVWKYLDKKAPEVLNQVDPEFLWSLDSLGITWRRYHEQPLKRFAGIHVHHGATISSSGLAVAKDILNYGVSLVRAHSHNAGVVFKTYPMSGQQLIGFETGHMCDPLAYGLKYALNPSWELGFGIGHIYEDSPAFQFIPITEDYTCVVDGKLFVG